MNITEVLVLLRDDLKAWATKNLLFLDKRTANIDDNRSGSLSVTDRKGNVILRVDEDGVKTTAVEANKVTGRGDKSLSVQDRAGNAILHVDENGVTTTKVTAKRLSDEADELLVTDRAGNAVLRVDRDGVTTPKVVTAKIKDDVSDEMIVQDNAGNTILRLDEYGLTTTAVKAKKLFDESDELLVTDSAGNTVFRLDKDGINAVGVKVNGAKVDPNAVRYTEQELTEEQKAQARANIGAASAGETGGDVSMENILDDESGELTVQDPNGNPIMRVDQYGIETTRVVADGIDLGAAVESLSAGGGGIPLYFVRYIKQALAEDEQAQARDNIGAAGENEVVVLKKLSAATPSSACWTAVAYGNGKFVAVAWGTTAAYSEDGINWTATTMPNRMLWNTVTYGNGKFVAGGQSAGVAYSEDGINWTAANIPDSVWAYSITYGNGKFVLVDGNSTGAAARAYYSEDGINWTAAALPSSGTSWYAVTYGNGRFVAVGFTDVAAYSEDGINWTATTMPSSGWWRCITYGGGKFVAMNNGTGAVDSDTAAYSEDGITWNDLVLPSATTWQDATYGNGKFVVSGDDGVAVYSEDGINWEALIVPTDADLSGVIYGEDKFVAVTMWSSEVIYSYDGINWQTGQTDLEQNGEDIAEDVANMVKPYLFGGDVEGDAFTVSSDGHAWFAGDVYVGSTSGTGKDEGSKKLATETYVDEKESAIYESAVGKKVEGLIFKVDGEDVTAGEGAEIFNDYEKNAATGEYSRAEGSRTAAYGNYSHAEGRGTAAYGHYSHAEGNSTATEGQSSHAEGANTTASGRYSHAEGSFTWASGTYSHTEGSDTGAEGAASHAEGKGTTAAGDQQHVQGRYNIVDEYDVYAHIVGNGTDDESRSNAHTLDWEGNAWFAGTVEGSALILRSSTEGSTKKFRITVNDNGNLSATEVT